MKNGALVECCDTKQRTPIAIIGIGCRFPGGGETPTAFWKMLLAGKDGITPIPADRWDADAFYHPDFNTKGKMQVKEGGFVDNIDMFDAQFFGIAPIEAKRMDPQQRMLLEQTFYAFEDAGVTLERMAGSRTGVFVGISATDYAGIQNSYTDRPNIGAHTNTGGAASIAANRISYIFDLIGPSFAVDTACSSGLVATHLACRSIWNGESEMTVVGGVNIILRPEIHIGFSSGGFLSPDCRCKTFDADANGYVRSEGVGVVLLKPLDKAIADNDQIYATIVGSALNEDGHTGGISMPNPDAQVDVLKRAYQDAGIDPQSVDYVEAHGTGTAVGDPIECNSIAAVLGKQNKKLLIGSVKSNIGHLEPASGLAGMIKTSLALKNRKIPANIHFKKPNPEIDFAGLGIAVPTVTENLGPERKILTAGINSFGFGGANAHVVMQSYTETKLKKQTAAGKAFPLVLSARSETALSQLAELYKNYLQSAEIDLADLCYSAATRRSAMEIRASIPCQDQKSTLKFLGDLAQGRENPLISKGRQAENWQGKTAFVFSGQGPQWFAMGGELLQSNEVFREAVSEVDKILKKLGWLKKEKSSLMHELQKNEPTSRMHETEIAQPAIFAIQVGLTKVWNSLGVSPYGIIGHSIGEVAASWAAGALSLEEATRVVFWRSHCQSALAGKGKMLAVGLSLEEVEERIAEFDGKVDIAAVNGPKMITLAGATKELKQLAGYLETESIFNRFLVVDVPFHSYMLNSILGNFKDCLGNVNLENTEKELFSTVSAQKISGKKLNASYWADNIRKSVLFYPTVREMVRQGYNNFIEISPHPILAHGLNEALKEFGREGIVVGSLKRTEAETPYLLSSLGKLFCHGVPICWSTLFKGKYNFLKLPHYPWQRDRYWIESSTSLELRKGTRVHPHLTDRIWSPNEAGTVLWDVELDSRTHPYIKDHRVQGPLIYPGAGHVDLALGVARASFGNDFGFLEDLEFMDPLFLPDDGEPFPLQISVREDEGDYFIATRRSKNDKDWTIHSRGQINHIGDKFKHCPVDLKKLRQRIKTPVKTGPLFDVLEKGGLQLGPTFKGLTKLWHTESEALGKIEVHANIKHDFQQYNIHPALLDASFQTAFGIISGTDYEGVYIPIQIKRIKFYKTPLSTIFSYAKAASYTDDIISADIWILNEQGELLLEIQGFTAKYLKGSRGEIQGQLNDYFYVMDWIRKDRFDQLAFRSPANYMPSSSELKNSLTKAVNNFKRKAVFKNFKERFSPAIEDIALSYMVDTLASLGLNFKKGQTFTEMQLRKKLGIIPLHYNLFSRIMEHLTMQNIFKLENGKYKFNAVPDIGKSKDKMVLAKKEFPEFSAELAMVDLSGPELQNLLTGKKDPIEFLFADENRHVLTDYYSEAYTFDKYHQLMAEGVKNLIAKLPEYQTLRILEIGAGTGSITKMILPLLPADRSEYFFTDISLDFMHQARDRFAEYQFVEYQAFDITKDIEKQQLVPGSYDLVIASNVIHSTPDVIKSLNAVRKLLATGGNFMMLEVTNTSMYPDLVFGLTEGWWNYLKDPLKRNRCTLDPDKWLQAFADAGFDQTLAVTDIMEKNEHVPIQTVFLSRTGSSENIMPPDNNTENGCWLIIQDQKGLAAKIADRLKKIGLKTEFVSMANIAELADFSPKDIPFKGVIYTAGIDTSEFFGMNDQKIENSIKSHIYPLLEVAKKLEKNPFASSLNLWIVTAGTSGIEVQDKIGIQQTPLIGLGRVIANEVRSFKTHLADLSSRFLHTEIDQLVQEIISAEADLSEEEIAFRGKKRFVRRLNRLTVPQREKASLIRLAASGSDYHLVSGIDGMIEELRLTETDMPLLGEDEVSIKVSHVPLNFRDVMLATGALPDKALSGGLFGKHFGLECCGIVSKTGKRVKNLKVGDRVMAIARDCIAGSVNAKADFTVKIPRGTVLAEIAALPMAYLTAYYGLVKSANLQAGEKVLIHAGTGGVGIAALSIARKIGAEIFVTASKEKHAFLKKTGIKYIYDSRSPSFYDEIMNDTKGQGVDVILNSLAGPLLTQSLKTLASCGRFVEIGKSDVYCNKRIGLERLADNCSYAVIDIDRLLCRNPEVISRCLKELFAQQTGFVWKKRNLIKHPYSLVNIADFSTALREMAQAKHLGKVILAMEGEISVNPKKQLKLDPKGAYLVAGGTGGFGLAVGKFLAKKGACHVILVSRGGKIRAEDMKMLEDIIACGTKVTIVKTDISRRASVEKLIRQIHSRACPLKGVFQSTMVLADGVLEDMDWQQFSIPLKSKIQGTWNLHLATEKLKLDYFVCFSSIASLYGTPGQANYAAANSFLDSFAYFRRIKGFPACTVNWGAIGEVGFVARNQETMDFLANHGWAPVSLSNVLSGLEQAMLDCFTQIGIFDVDWTVFAETFPHNAVSGRYAHLHHEADYRHAAQEDRGSFADQLRASALGERHSLAHDVLRGMMANVLGMSKDKIDVQTPLTRMGIDSLMANQIRSWLTNQTGVPFSLMQIMQGPTLAELSALILESITSAGELMVGKNRPSPWFLIPKPVKNPGYRLFCFPYMGVGGSVYNGWQDLLPNDIELIAVQLPGREERSAETPLFDTRILFKQLAQEILTLLDRPYIFYGHSFGGNIAMSFATYLNGVHQTHPHHLFIGAAIPPSVLNPLENDFESAERTSNAPVDDKALTELLRKLGTSESVLNEPKALQKIFPVVQGDLAMSRQRLISKDEILPCPITAIAGEKDDIYSPEMISEWQIHSKDFSLHKIPGSHLFIHERSSLQKLIKIITEAI